MSWSAALMSMRASFQLVAATTQRAEGAEAAAELGSERALKGVTGPGVMSAAAGRPESLLGE